MRGKCAMFGILVRPATPQKHIYATARNENDMAENEQTIPVQIRFPPEIVRRIDMKIDSGEFTSRADYVRYVTTRSFEDEDEVDRLKVALYELLTSGVADDVLREQIRKINREVW